MGEKKRRHLPVLGQGDAPQEPVPEPGEAPERPAWQWVALIAVLTLLAWVAFAGVGNRLVLGAGASLQAIVIMNVVALGSSAFLAGLWGGRGGASRTLAALGGACTASFGWFLALAAIASAGTSVAALTLLALAGIASLGSALGAHVGLGRPRLSE